MQQGAETLAQTWLSLFLDIGWFLFFIYLFIRLGLEILFPPLIFACNIPFPYSSYLHRHLSNLPLLFALLPIDHTFLF